MKFSLILLLISWFLFGCSSTPEFLNNQTPIYIEQTELDKYWIHKTESFSFSSSSYVPPSTDGFVLVKYLIDSNGNTYNSEIIKSDSTGAWNKIALKAVKKIHYVNAETNPKKTPVYVVTEFTFNNK